MRDVPLPHENVSYMKFGMFCGRESPMPTQIYHKAVSAGFLLLIMPENDITAYSSRYLQ